MCTQGSDRAIKQHFYDAMEIVKEYGKGDLFITFTANPHWDEIKQMIPPGLNYLSMPHVCSRVYNLKFNEFWNDITKEHKLGAVDAHVNVKEYQKRGLPHHHCMVWFDENDKITSAERVDELVCAEIPDQNEDPELYELVTKLMIHGPCLPNSPCMQLHGNKCSKGFPKQYTENTIIRENNYPLYRRRNNGRTVRVRGRDLDNRYVVPYNPKILKAFRTHCNVEVCGFLNTMKYLFNYMCKGNTRANVEIHGLGNLEPHVNRGVTNEELVHIRERAQEQLENEVNNQQPEIQQIVHYDDYDVQVMRERPNPDPDDQLLINNLAEFEQQTNRQDQPVNENQQQAQQINNIINEQRVEQQEVEQAEQQQARPNVPNIVPIYDETKTYEQSRMISPIESNDKLMGYKRMNLSHPVTKLPIHGENGQNVIVDDNGIRDALRNNQPAPQRLISKLDDYFDLNRRDPSMRNHLYKDIVNFYWWNAQNRQWTPRRDPTRASKAIGRIYYIHPRQTELFHIKILLLHVRGKTSFEDLRTVDGIVYPTFTAAAIALNLVENNRQWFTCIREIIRTELPHRIR